MSSLRGGDGEIEFGTENGERRMENGTTLVMIADKSGLLKSGIVIFD